MSQKKPAPIEGLVFDMDGLLVDSEKIVQRSWEHVGKILGYPDIGSHIYHTIGMNVVGREEYFRKHIAEDFPMEKFTAMTRQKFHEIVDTEGLDIKPGAKELLLFAKERGLKTGLATSSRRQHAQENLTRLGIFGYFDGVVCGDMVTRSKPDPEIYEKACHIICTRPENTIALEDAPSGIQSAYGAGMRPIMIPDMVEPAEETKKLIWYRFDTLFDVIKLLEHILP